MTQGQWPAPVKRRDGCDCFKTWTAAVRGQRFRNCLGCWRIRHVCQWLIGPTLAPGQACPRCGGPVPEPLRQRAAWCVKLNT